MTTVSPTVREGLDRRLSISDAGVPTHIIGDMLPCLNRRPEILVIDQDPATAKMLITQRDKMTERIAFLEHNHDALHRYIEAMDAAEAPSSVVT